jgi:hypothetical protein
MVRTAATSEELLAGAYALLGRQPPGDDGEPMSLRLNRLPNAWGESEPAGERAVPDPEAEDLLRWVESSEAKEEGVYLFGEGGFGPFAIATRSVVCYFEPDEIELPETARGLIDYPLGGPLLFPVETGTAPWDVWEVCCAFADQYQRVYQEARRYGVWGHDLTDLWIERLFYYPSKRLLYPFIGS